MASVLFRGGAVFDGWAYRQGVDVLVAGGRVHALGPAGSLALPVGVDVVDLQGGLLLPGFTDAHVHPLQGGLERIRCDLSAVRGRTAYLERIAAHLHTDPGMPWVLGGGWAMGDFVGGTPTATDLDGVVADRPAFLVNRDHHGAWVNTRALQLAGIDRRTPDPDDGRIERDADGHPTGTLHEGAMVLVGALVPPARDDELDRALAEAQRHLLAHGVTGCQDAIWGAYDGMTDPVPTYLRARALGDLRPHVVGALWWDRTRGLDQVGQLVRRRDELRAAGLAATSVKVMLDGVAENGTAALGAPYLDRCGCATSNRGLSFVEPRLLGQAVTELDRRGFQVHVHAIGDRAVREALDAFTLAARGRRRGHATGEGHADPRHHIAHLQMVHPRDVPRFSELKVTATVQALWACRDDQMADLTLPFLDEDRARWQYPFGDLHRHGTRLAAGSDWPVSSVDPLAAVHVAVNRSEPEAVDEVSRAPFLPEQALDLTAALAAYTRHSAWLNHADDRGVLRPGAVADLAVLDADPFRLPALGIGTVRVRSTWLAGEQAWSGS